LDHSSLLVRDIPDTEDRLLFLSRCPSDCCFCAHKHCRFSGLKHLKFSRGI